MSRDVFAPFCERVLCHGTTAEAAAAILREGFRVWRREEGIGRIASGGNLGVGIYLTLDPEVARWFGPAVLRVTLSPGTRLLNAARPPDRALLDSLVREFGREILTRPPRKVLPANKKLSRDEVIQLFRHHYVATWERDWGRDREGVPRWPPRRDRHAAHLDEMRSLLLRHGFHGFGNPADDNGIVVFAEDRLRVVGLLEAP
jgi:hypothetical protein